MNIKLEKAGGIRGALLVADKAHQLGLKVWVGVMVGSSLNSNAAGMYQSGMNSCGDRG